MSSIKNINSLYCLLGFTVLYGFLFNIDILDFKYENKQLPQATSAKVGLFIRPGIVVEDINRRQTKEDWKVRPIIFKLL